MQKRLLTGAILEMPGTMRPNSSVAIRKYSTSGTICNGELSIVEDENVKQAMKNFGGAVRQWEKYNSGGSDFSPPSIFELEDKQGNPQTFDQLAYELSQACRQSLEK